MSKYAVLVFATAALFSGCASSPRLGTGRKGELVLRGFEPRVGGHCESSAMLNALAYLGYGVTEADIVGGGGAPAFIFTNEGFPFIGGRNELMRESFLEAAGIRYGVAVPATGKDGWAEIFELLERGLPVLLRVDMRYLPYLYGGKFGPAYMSFGWHVICLYGVDFDSGTAWVTDTQHGGPREIALRDLDRARFSRTRTYPPRGEYAWIEPRPEAWSLDADRLTRSALAEVLRNYDGQAGWGGGEEEPAAASVARAAPKAGPLVGLAGLAAFPGTLASLHDTVNPHALGAAYSYMGDTIERNGTGGSAFRRLFRDFLAARAADCADPALRESCARLVPAAESAAGAWSALADSFYASAGALGAAKGGAARTQAIAASEAEAAARAMELFEAEKALRDAIAAATGAR